MHITEIYYEKVFPIAPYVNEKIGIKVAVAEYDNAEEIFNDAKHLVNTWGYKMMEDRPSGIAQTFDAPAQLSGNAYWDKPEAEGEADKEFEAVKAQLEKFTFREDAQEYLNTTSFKFTVAAKKIVEQKPSKEF